MKFGAACTELNDQLVFVCSPVSEVNVVVVTLDSHTVTALTTDMCCTAVRRGDDSVVRMTRFTKRLTCLYVINRRQTQKRHKRREQLEASKATQPNPRIKVFNKQNKNKKK